MKKVCHVFAAGELYGWQPEVDEGDLVLAADAGYRHALALGVRVDWVIGDLDSLGGAPEDVGLIRLNPVKDETDAFAALSYALDKGFRAFRLYGFLGGRVSHAVSNIACLGMLAARGAQAIMYGNGELLTAVKDAELRFDASSRGGISVFALSGACRGVYERGLKYSLTDYTMRPDYPIGVSNEFTGAEGIVSVREGTLLIVCQAGARFVQ